MGDKGLRRKRSNSPEALSREEVVEALVRVVKEVGKDPEVRKKEEESRKKHGTLTAEDLALTFTI